MSTKSKIKPPQGLAAVWRDSLLATFAAIDAHLGESAATDAIVHTARRELKRLAALARLAPSSLKQLARDTRRSADVTRRALGGRRNTTVMNKLIDGMSDKLGEQAQLVRAAIEHSARTHPAEEVAAGRDSLTKLREAWKAVENVEDEALTARVVKGYRRARNRADAAAEGSAKALHRWRSAIVAHHYQMAFLARVAPELKAHAKDVDALRDRLGDWNDIDMLQAHAHDGLAKANRKALAEAVAGDKHKLETAASRSGAKLFEPKPRVFHATITAALTAAQAEKPASAGKPQKPKKAAKPAEAKPSA